MTDWNPTKEQLEEWDREIDEERNREYYEPVDDSIHGYCDFCTGRYLKEEMITTTIDDGEIVNLCEGCRDTFIENGRE